MTQAVHCEIGDGSVRRTACGLDIRSCASLLGERNYLYGMLLPRVRVDPDTLQQNVPTACERCMKHSAKVCEVTL